MKTQTQIKSEKTGRILTVKETYTKSGCLHSKATIIELGIELYIDYELTRAKPACFFDYKGTLQSFTVIQMSDKMSEWAKKEKALEERVEAERKSDKLSQMYQY